MPYYANLRIGQLLLNALLMLTLTVPMAYAQSGGGAITPTETPSGFAGVDDWIIDDIMQPFDEARSKIQTASSSGKDGGVTNDLGERLGLTGQHVSSGIGGQYLGTILGADVMNAATRFFPGGGVEGVRNPVISQTLRYGTYLGVFFTCIFLIAHAVTSFFNKMEYGDFLGEAKERFIGGFRAVIAFALVMPISSSGISGATYGVAMAAAASNGIGNKAAQVVVDGGFGSDHGSATDITFAHRYNPESVSSVFANGVAIETCRQYLRTSGTNAVEIGAICGSVVSYSHEDIDVEYDPETASESEDLAYCEASFDDASFRLVRDKRYVVIACQATLKSQREARNKIREVIENYDGDLEHPDAAVELQQIAQGLHDEVRGEVHRINSEVFDDYNPNKFSNYVHQGMSELVSAGGWPAMGLIYAEVGSQIDAINSIQGLDPSVGFDMKRLSEAGSHAKSLQRIVSRNAAMSSLGDAAGEGGVIEGGGNRPFLGWLFRWMPDAWGSVTDAGEDLARGIVAWLFDPMFSQPGPAATHTIGSGILGSAMAVVAVHDLAWLAEKTPAGRVFSAASKSGAKTWFDIASRALGNFAEGSMIVKIVSIYISIMLMLVMLVATFLVAVLPKLPIFFVSFLAIEWAIWCTILIFTAPIWVALNMTVISNQPGLFTQRALSGLGVLTYILLFPAMVVIAVVVSLIAYNLIIPILGALLLLSFGGGGVSSIIGMFTMPVLLLLAMSVGGFVAVSAITKVPSMITGFLNIQAPGESVTQQATSFVASPMHYSNMTNPGQMLTGSAGQLVGKGLSK